MHQLSKTNATHHFVSSDAVLHVFTSVGESLSDSMSDALECPEPSSLSSVFTLSRPPEKTGKHTISWWCWQSTHLNQFFIVLGDLLRSVGFSSAACCSWPSCILSDITSEQLFNGSWQTERSPFVFTGLLPGRLKSLQIQNIQYLCVSTKQPMSAGIE